MSNFTLYILTTIVSLLNAGNSWLLIAYPQWIVTGTILSLAAPFWAAMIVAIADNKDIRSLTSKQDSSPSPRS